MIQDTVFVKQLESMNVTASRIFLNSTMRLKMRQSVFAENASRFGFPDKNTTFLKTSQTLHAQ